MSNEAGHWYAQDGTPCYEVPRVKGGGFRPTTLRDARKLNLSPSVTGIIKILSAPMLTNWIAEQAALSGKSLRRSRDETDTEFARRAVAESRKQVTKAADDGSKIHDALEQHFTHGTNDTLHQPYIDGVEEALKKLDLSGEMFVAEKSFTYGGYGGKVDLHSRKIIADFKTKDFTSNDKMPQVYDYHLMQLAAYRRGLGLGDVPGLILFVSRTEPGLVHPVQIEPEKLDYGEKLFNALLNVWQISNKYVPDCG